jgi:molybdenum cofactor biosynthesis enzyme MoaA
MIPNSTTFDYFSEFDKWSMDNQHLCVIPYSNLGVHVGEKRRDPCCWYKSDQLDNPIAEVKKNIESGQIDKNCQLCYTQESNNQFSGRQQALAQLNPSDLPKFLTTKKIDTFFMFVTFSNKCNMACRICNADTSSLYDSIWNNNKNEPKSISDDPTYFEIIKSDIREIINQYKFLKLAIMGGEGTVQSDLYMLTDWLQEENLSNKIDLQIGTNGSVFLEETFSSWCNNFKSLSFAISVDSTDEDNFVYVRYPVKFEKIHNNLQKFKLLTETHSNVDFDIRPTFYINNIVYLKEFLDYFEKFTILNRNIRIFNNTLSQCDHLSLLALPLYLRKKLSEQIQEILSQEYSLFIQNPVFKKSIHSFLDQLTSNNFSETNWATYISTTAKWDKLTNTNLSVNNKKFWDLLCEEDKNSYYRHIK